MSGFDYMVSRTTKRPRELLQFVRQAHDIAIESGDNEINSQSIIIAEEDFSSWKLEHLCAEYKYILPGLDELLWMFRAQGPVLDDNNLKNYSSI